MITAIARILSGVAALSSDEWDACAGTANPFVSHAFLTALEESHSVGGRSGWTPAPIVVDGPDGRPAAIAPAYLKAHSQGEYVFDHGWADAWERAGGRYYPKLQIASPFSPVPGPRLLLRDPALAPALIAAIEAAPDQNELSSAHVTFVAAAVEGLTIRHLSGAEIGSEHWDAFWAFYQDTGSRKWGRPYLTRAAFDRIGERLGDKVLLILAERDGAPIAGALNLIGEDTLYGRYWGATEEVPFLHFELCYYQAIDAAIARGLKTVEAGAQGEHKLARGYVPVPTFSAHYIPHPAFRRAVAEFVEREREAIAAESEFLGELTPFRRG